MRLENKQLVISAFMISLYITIISPLSILIGNYDEFYYGIMEILFVASPYFVALLFVLIISVINGEILFSNYGAFDGRGVDIEESSSVSIVQMLVAVAVACAVSFLGLRKNLIVFSSVYVVLNNVLKSNIDKPVLAKSVGTNNDQRLLGLGFESMVFQ